VNHTGGGFVIRGVIVLLVNTYLCGWLVTTAVVIFAADRFSAQSRVRPGLQMSLAVLCGALWPLVILGIVELGFVAMLAKAIKFISPTRSDDASTQELNEMLTP
jgi:biotin transporter BioY